MEMKTFVSFNIVWIVRSRHAYDTYPVGSGVTIWARSCGKGQAKTGPKKAHILKPYGGEKGNPRDPAGSRPEI